MGITSETSFGKYQLQRLIARGGMAEVHLAVERTEHAGNRLVVLKRILPIHKDDPDYVEFFVHEARLALQLVHPNIVQTYEFGRADDIHYLAMEYVRGHTALAMMRRAAQLGRQLSLDAVAKLGVDIAAALDHTHRATDASGVPLMIVHRDVSPHNIVVAREGSAKLVDFGIARASIQEFHTATGIIKGKFAYLAPEQLRRGSTFDQRADLWALGVVLYELISRRPLFKGTTDSDTVRRILAGRIPALRQLRPDCPVALAAVVHRALERSPAARYHKAAHMQSDLEEAARTSGLFPTVTCLRTQLEELFDGSGPTKVHETERAPTGATRQMPRATPSRPDAFQPQAGPLAMSPTLSPTPPTPLPIQPRLASPPLETLAPTPIPDQQLEHFLRLASARRSRAETVGVPALMSMEQLPDEPMELLDAALLAAEVEADEDTPMAFQPDPELERVLGAQVALPEVDPAELPLPAPRHETTPPDLGMPAVASAPRAISGSEAPPPLGSDRHLRRRRRLLAAALALAAAGTGVLVYVLALS